MTKAFFPRVIDSSMLGAFRACPHKFFREYVQHWKHRGQSVHLHAGAAFAHGLERARTAYYVDGLPSDEAERIGADALMEAYGDFLAPPESAKSLDRMLGALDFYFTNYPMQMDAATPITFPGGKRGIEFSFAQPLPINNPETGEPIIFSGRSDMIVDFANGVYIEDDKTTSSLGASWAKNWEMRGQFSGYCWAAREIGIPITGVLVRGVSILKTKYDTQQVLTYRTDEEMDRWIAQTLRDIQRMIGLWHEGYWDFNLDESCAHYGGCAFMNACKSPDPDGWIENDFEQRVWDPLGRRELPIDEYLATWKD